MTKMKVVNMNQLQGTVFREDEIDAGNLLKYNYSHVLMCNILVMSLC